MLAHWSQMGLRTKRAERGEERCHGRTSVNSGARPRHSGALCVMRMRRMARVPVANSARMRHMTIDDRMVVEDIPSVQYFGSWRTAKRMCGRGDCERFC